MRTKKHIHHQEVNGTFNMGGVVFYYDSIKVYQIIGTQQTRIAAKRYNGTGPVDITFSAPSSQVKVEFVAGNILNPNYAYYVDNMRLSTVTGSVIYTSNFISNTIVSQNTDGWESDWASSYMNVSSGSLNQLRVSGTAPSVQRIFTSVQANNEHTLTYVQSQNNAIQLVVEQSSNGTTWSTLLSTTTSNGTQTHTFTPTQTYLRARYSATASFQVSEILLNGIEVDMVVNVTPGGFAKYRYSFQGQEHDDEVKGKGNSINYTYRMHDPRLGRFFAVDPLASKYPFYSPYAFSGNRVIDAFELEGLEPADAKKGANILVVVILGYEGKNPPPEKTQNNNNPYSKSDIDRQTGLTGLTRIESVFENNSDVQITIFSSSTIEKRTQSDVVQTMKTFMDVNPNGKIVLVGHSLGAENAVDVAANNPDISIDLMYLIDISSKSGFGGNNNISSNVNYLINVRQSNSFPSGQTARIDDPNKTIGFNHLAKDQNVSHTSVENIYTQKVINRIQRIISGVNPLTNTEQGNIQQKNEASEAKDNKALERMKTGGQAIKY